MVYVCLFRILTTEIQCEGRYRSGVFVCVPADAADEAVGVVGPAQGRHHLSGDVLVAAVTLGAVEPLEVLGADVLARVVEEPRVHQVAATHCSIRDRHKPPNKISDSCLQSYVMCTFRDVTKL